MHYWWALWAALAMLGEDLLATWLVQAQSRGHASLSGLLDVAGWPMAMITTFATVSAWQGHNALLKVLVVLAVSAANFIGTYFAVRIGQKRIKVAVACTCCPIHQPTIT